MKKRDKLKKTYDDRTEADFKALTEYSASISGNIKDVQKVDELLSKNHRLYETSGVIITITSKDGSSVDTLYCAVRSDLLGAKAILPHTVEKDDFLRRSIEIAFKCGKKELSTTDKDGRKINLFMPSSFIGYCIIKAQLIPVIERHYSNKMHMLTGLITYALNTSINNGSLLNALLDVIIRHKLTSFNTLTTDIKLSLITKAMDEQNALDIFKKLVSLDPDIVRTSLNFIPFILGQIIHSPIITDKFELAEMLLQHGANPNAMRYIEASEKDQQYKDKVTLVRNEQGVFCHRHTLLVSCVTMGMISFAKLLIDYGADVNTPLFVEESPGAIAVALANKDQNMIELLLERGSRLPYLVDAQGKLILDEQGIPIMLLTSQEDIFSNGSKEFVELSLMNILRKTIINVLEKTAYKKSEESSAHGDEEVGDAAIYSSHAALGGIEVAQISVPYKPIPILGPETKQKVKHILDLYRQINPHSTSTIESKIEILLMNSLLADNALEILEKSLPDLIEEYPEASAAIIVIAHSLGTEIIQDPRDFIGSLAINPQLLHKYFQGEFNQLLSKKTAATIEHSWVINRKVITSADPHVYEITSTTKSKFFIYIPEEIWRAHEGLLNKLSIKDLRFIPQGSEKMNGVKLFDHVAELKLISEIDGQGDVRISSDCMYRNEDKNIVIVFNYDTDHADVFSAHHRKKKKQITDVPSLPIEQGRHGEVHDAPGLSTASLLGEKAEKTSPQKEGNLSSDSDTLATTAFVFGVSIGALLEIIKSNSFMASFMQKVMDVIKSMQKKPINIVDQAAKDLERSTQENFEEESPKPSKEEKPDTKQAEKTNLHPDDFFFFAGEAGGKQGASVFTLLVYKDPLEGYITTAATYPTSCSAEMVGECKLVTIDAY